MVVQVWGGWKIRKAEEEVGGKGRVEVVQLG